MDWASLAKKPLDPWECEVNSFGLQLRDNSGVARVLLYQGGRGVSLADPQHDVGSRIPLTA